MREIGTDRRRYLARQIEQVRDSEGDIHEVIVKVRPKGGRDEQFVATVAEALRRRGLSSSARDCLPVARDVLSRDVTAPGEASKLQSADRSVASQITRTKVERRPTAKRTSLAALNRFLSSQVVQEVQVAKQSELEGLSSLGGRRPDPVDPVAFWPADSALLQVRSKDLDRLVDELEQVEDIYLNQRLATPPLVSPKFQTVEENKVSSWGVRTVGALAVWGAFNCRGKGTRIAVLDTGVDASHPDLKGKVTAWAEFNSNGQLVSKNLNQAHDSDQHGTHCAGTIAGGNASGRWIGMAPEAQIAAGLVLNGQQGGTHAQILAGMTWATELKVDAISMSLGGFILGPETPSFYTSAILTALQEGIPVVTAIGNEGSQTSGTPGNDFLAFAVGATDDKNRAAGFSGGRTQIIKQSEYFNPAILPLVYSKPDVAAPGVAVSFVGSGRKMGSFQRHVDGGTACRGSNRLVAQRDHDQVGRQGPARISHSGLADWHGRGIWRGWPKPSVRLWPDRCSEGAGFR